MASTSTLPPPPGQDDGPSQDPQGPTAPASVSPAPPEPSSGGTLASAAIQVVHLLRTIASGSPLAAPGVQKMNQIMAAEVMPQLMQSQKTGEPAAPPGA